MLINGPLNEDNLELRARQTGRDISELRQLMEEGKERDKVIWVHWEEE